jgi:glycerol dehydrogenase
MISPNSNSLNDALRQANRKLKPAHGNHTARYPQPAPCPELLPGSLQKDPGQYRKIPGKGARFEITVPKGRVPDQRFTVKKQSDNGEKRGFTLILSFQTTILHLTKRSCFWIMSRVIASPSKYIQGSGELLRIKDHIEYLGGPVLFVLGAFACTHLKAVIEESYKNSGLTVIFEQFSGECTRKEIERLRVICRKHNCAVVVGVGGGKALDTAKGVACSQDIPVISVPTIASTDAPTSAIAVTYTEDHVFDGNILLPQNPELVIVDTDVITRAPVRFLVAGMGDALSTYFEARANAASGHDNFAGGKSTNASLTLAKLCYEILIRDGLKAKLSAEKGVCSPEVENIIEANIYLSGVGFESNGLACAHSVYNAFTTLPPCHTMFHGELVAFGTIVQLVLEKRPDEEIAEVLRFCTSVGLPVTFAELSERELTRDEIMTVAVTACSPQNFMESEPFHVTPDMMADALAAADAMGRKHRAMTG